VNSTVRTLAPFGVLLVGVGVAALFVATRPTPQKVASTPLPTRVDVTRVQRGPEAIRVHGMGSVIAAREVDVKPEVSGRVRSFDDRLIPGGLFRAGERMLRVDTADYKIALEQAQADVARARFEYELEQGRQRIAKKEFELLERDQQLDETGSDLALRRPHLRNAKAALEAAQSRLRKAELDLARTAIRAPFDAFVQAESVEVGQLVSPQTTVARLVGTEVFWVQVSIPVAALDWIDDGALTPAVVRHQAITRTGRVLQVLPDLDPKGRMARVLVAIDDPLDLSPTDPSQPSRPLRLGAYVDVTLEGATADVAVVPRSALRDGDRVWLMGPDDELVIRDVDTVWRERTVVYVSDGLTDGDRLITSRIAAPVPGMKLRTGSEPEKPAASL
jgi:RND family efflux transporter MFP subunit